MNNEIMIVNKITRQIKNIIFDYNKNTHNNINNFNNKNTKRKFTNDLDTTDNSNKKTKNHY